MPIATSTEGDEPAPPMWERLAAGLALAVLTNGLIAPLLAPDQENVTQGEALRVIWPPVYAVFLVLAGLSLRRMRRVWPGASACVVLLGWCLASSGWSIDADVTLRRCIALAFTTLAGLYLAARYSWRGLVELLMWTLVPLALMSYVAALAFPAWGVNHTDNPGDWKGVWYEKNALGETMAIGVLAALSAALATPRRRLWRIGAGTLFLGLVLASRSKTSLLVVLAGSAVAGGLVLVRRGPAPAVLALWVGGMVAGLTAAVMAFSPALMFQALGKNATLTGRTDIWVSLLKRVAERPWLGYGYSAFWNLDPHGPAAIVRHETRWLVPSAHNGWLDLLVQLGWVGVILFAANYLLTLGAAAAGAFRRRDGGFAVIWLLVLGLFSLSESTILQHNNLSWVLYVAVMAKLFEHPPVASVSTELTPGTGERPAFPEAGARVQQAS